MRHRMINLANAGDRDAYIKKLHAWDAAGECPLCEKGLREAGNEILRVSNGWQLITTRFPYKNTDQHLLILPIKHVDSFREITGDDFVTVQSLLLWAVEHFQMPGGGLTLRFGDLDYSGATISHVHFHIIVPSFNQSTALPYLVNFPLGRKE